MDDICTNDNVSGDSSIDDCTSNELGLDRRTNLVISNTSTHACRHRHYRSTHLFSIIFTDDCTGSTII
jgi:hypothetical protein